MVFELTNNIDKVASLFAEWEETLIYSCIQQIMGRLFVTDMNHPKAVCAHVGCFAFYTGEPDMELVMNKPEGFTIMVPQNTAWSKMIEYCFPYAKKVTRYAIKKNTQFDEKKLCEFVNELPDGYEICKIDSVIYDKCLLNPLTVDFVSAFRNKEMYLKYGRGMVILKNNEIVSGASSYARYLQGIEIEVDTIPTERRKHLATTVCAALILECLKAGLYPSWDAQNIKSVHLAEKLGYVFSHEYTAYEVWDIEKILIYRRRKDYVNAFYIRLHCYIIIDGDITFFIISGIALGEYVLRGKNKITPKEKGYINLIFTLIFFFIGLFYIGKTDSDYFRFPDILSRLIMIVYILFLGYAVVQKGTVTTKVKYATPLLKYYSLGDCETQKSEFAFVKYIQLFDSIRNVGREKLYIFHNKHSTDKTFRNCLNIIHF